MEWVRIIILFLILSIWEICEDDLNLFAHFINPPSGPFLAGKIGRQRTKHNQLIKLQNRYPNVAMSFFSSSFFLILTICYCIMPNRSVFRKYLFFKFFVLLSSFSLKISISKICNRKSQFFFLLLTVKSNSILGIIPPFDGFFIIRVVVSNLFHIFTAIVPYQSFF
jgi:hypothetical protein